MNILKKNSRTGPLDHIRVLDLGQTLAGPLTSTILSDLGAEVIKVERPNHGDQTRHFAPFLKGESHYFLSINRNKKSITIDLKSEEGKKVFWDLVKKCDVLIENFRPGVMEKMGFGKDAIHAVKPDMIICSISAFGSTGPYGNKAGYDIMLQALSGAMSLTGEQGKPMRSGFPIGDIIGGLYGAVSILGAVVEKEKTGKGLNIDLSLLDNLVSLLGYFSGKYFLTGESDLPVGSHHPFIVPYGTYKTSNGFIVLAVYTEEFWRKFAITIEKSEWLNDDRFSSNGSRVENRDLLIDLIQQVIKTKTIDEWGKVFDANDITYAPILDVEGVLNHPQVQARNLIKEVEHPTYGTFKHVGTPIRYSNAPLDNNAAPPTLGEHTEEVLKNILGYTSAEIDKVMKIGVKLS